MRGCAENGEEVPLLVRIPDHSHSCCILWWVGHTHLLHPSVAMGSARTLHPLVAGPSHLPVSHCLTWPVA